MVHSSTVAGGRFAMARAFRWGFWMLALMACVHAFAAVPDSERPPAGVEGAWTVTVEGQPRTRTLTIRGVQAQGDGTWMLDALYGWSDGRASPVTATLAVTPPRYVLRWTTGAGSTIEVEGDGLDVLNGTFTTKGGRASPVRIARAGTGGESLAVDRAGGSAQPAGWSVRMSWTVSLKEYGRETARFSYETASATAQGLHVLFWEGGLDARPPKPRRIRLLTLDQASGLFGVSRYGSVGTFSPFEPWGCAPIEARRDCLSKPFRFEVSNVQNWLHGTVQKARFADRTEQFRLEGSGEEVEVLRFSLGVQRNNGWYTREMLYSPRFPYPVYSVSRLDGAREVSSAIVDYRIH